MKARRPAPVALALLVTALVGGCTADPAPSAVTSGGTSVSTSVSSSSTSRPSSAGPSPAASGPSPVRAGSDYLALGDSVSFGYREPDTSPAPDYANASDFTGFPELVARALHLHLANASCPGETSASLRDSHAAGFGCERGADGDRDRGYRTHYPLHVRYRGSQLGYGLRYLRSHPDTRLVTLMIGANDAFRCAERTDDRCTSEVTSLLPRVTRNVRAVLRAVRDGAHYTGRIVLVSYYSSTYGGLTAAVAGALDHALRFGGRGQAVLGASGFAAFERVTRRSGGSSCRAGLLTRLTSGGCGVHPSAAGQRLLADAVERAADTPGPHGGA